jgi:hypothetical protein
VFYSLEDHLPRYRTQAPLASLPSSASISSHPPAVVAGLDPVMVRRRD